MPKLRTAKKKKGGYNKERRSVKKIKGGKQIKGGKTSKKVRVVQRGGNEDIRAIVFKVNDDITAQNTVVKFLLTTDNQQSDRNQTGITLGGVHVSFRGQYMLPKVALTISSSGDQTQLLDSAKSHGTQIRLIP